MTRMNGKVAFITGAGGGQGAAEAELFAREGASLVLSDVDASRVAAIAAKVEKAGARAIWCKQDVTIEADWVSAVEKAQQTFGALHVLVNNAGTISRQGIANTELANWNRTLDVNLTGAMLGMKHCAPAMRDAGGGAIINVSSTAGLGAHYDAAYTASKWGLRGLTKSASVEFVEWNIRVNSIHPGQIVDTSFYREGSPGHAESGRLSVPMQRQGTPLECAQLVLFLASDEASYITGAEIAIDGGYSAAGGLWLRNRLRDTLAASSPHP
ncbi:SDR family oxidoreductase [Mesorhizobium sp. M1D.F.Ca.ET.043.01.1.1]|uniref:SDR family NAD(P)-dependent oxidoreductase n=1 Tax=Mesorhizobium sp. M1D.F.Ca.ET.043.01.1.1 TaxID=2493669 RepID=UPI000F7554DF|nr:SDR family oxidoreductase [Mesorhizobium sp. M1D.F.Ca.ET.043.01.1.1]AZO73484.1 SDR family oxidoreductase [Mesorhizobium sp. M1D.F.Ca.ET.043.01.1.1]